MSLENTIAANTEAVAAQTTAINTLIALLQNTASTVQSAKAAEGTNTSAVLANDKADEKPAKTAKTPKADKSKAEPKPEPEQEAEVAAETGALTYADIAPLVVEMAKKDRAKAIEVLGEFGAKNAKELKPEQYAGFKAKAEKVLAGEADDDLV